MRNHERGKMILEERSRTELEKDKGPGQKKWKYKTRREKNWAREHQGPGVKKARELLDKNWAKELQGLGEENKAQDQKQ